MYQLTHSSVAVGLIGVAQLVPYVALSLVGGTIVDSVDRRRLLLLTQALLAIASAVLMAAALLGFTATWILYVMAGVISAVSAVNLPTESAIVPNLVKREHLAAALSLDFAQFQASLVVGPAIGGVVIATLGLPVAYGLDVATFAAAIAAALAIAPQPPAGKRTESALRSMIEGFRYVRKQGAITGGFAIDLNAMIFGMPRALFPALAAATYHAGPQGLGLLYAAPGVGAVIGSLLSGFVGRIRHQGRAVVIAAAGWAIAIGLFGLATMSLWLGLVCLAIAGASDIISAVARNTILQTTAPEPAPRADVGGQLDGRGRRAVHRRRPRRHRGSAGVAAGLDIVGKPHLRGALRDPGAGVPGAMALPCRADPGRPRPRRRGARTGLEGLAAGEALADAVPVGDAGLAEAPAELDHLAVPLAKEVDQAGAGILDGHIHGLEALRRIGKRHLGGAQGSDRLRQLLLLDLPRAIAPEAVLLDAHGLRQIGQLRGDVNDSLHQPPDLG